MLHADFNLRWEGDVYWSEAVATTVERNIVLIAYPNYSSRKPACSNDQSTEHVKDAPFSPPLPLLTGTQGRGAEAEGVGVGEAKPKYFSCDELLTSQACPWYWEKKPTNKQKREARSCLREKQGHGSRWPGSHTAWSCRGGASQLWNCWGDFWDTLLWQKREPQPRISGATLCGWSPRGRREFPIVLSLSRLLITGLPGQTKGFSLRIWNERNSFQVWSHSCFNIYQRERLVPGNLLLLGFIT